MRLQHYYYASSRKYTELLIATLAALCTLSLLAAMGGFSVMAEPLVGVAEAKALTAVSAASFRSNEIAPEGIVAAFGNELATGTQAADVWPLPHNLLGTSVRLRDALGQEQSVPLFFVAPGQVNFYVPLNTAMGEATITIFSGDGSFSQGVLQIVGVAPGLFTMNANGAGVPAANLLRVRGSGRYYEILARFDLDANQWMTLPIDFGLSADRLFLVVFGTGIRGRASLSDVTMTIGGESAPVSYAGAQGGLFGIDQINVEIPRELEGRGEVNVVLTVNGKESNTVKINLK